MQKNDIESYEPQAVWKEFAAISGIPRGSGNEKGIRSYILKVAEESGLETKTDAVGNIVVTIPGSQGRETEPVLVLQGHMDMVCEKNRDKEHDFLRDPISLVVDGEWLRADGTTLGADNGIAVAMMLALMNGAASSHGPLECLFTVDEETALTGALNLDPEMITGRTLLNLDSEEEGVFYIGCAGGINTEGKVPILMEPVQTPLSCFELSLTGLMGGHSGADIHLNRGNALVLGSRLLKLLADRAQIRLIGLEGGDKHNAIPREFFATFLAADEMKVRDVVKAFSVVAQNELGDRDPDLSIQVSQMESSGGVALTQESQKRVLDFLLAMPNGIQAMSSAISGLVHSSTNFAAVKMDSTMMSVLTSQRSSRDSEGQAIADSVAALIELAGGESEFLSAYPGWDPDPRSPILARCLEVWKKRGGTSPEVTAIHAGLECGVIGSKIPGIDMVSFGPDLKDVHTPRERMHIESMNRIWQFLLELLS